MTNAQSVVVASVTSSFSIELYFSAKIYTKTLCYNFYVMGGNSTVEYPFGVVYTTDKAAGTTTCTYISYRTAC